MHHTLRGAAGLRRACGALRAGNPVRPVPTRASLWRPATLPLAAPHSGGLQPRALRSGALRLVAALLVTVPLLAACTALPRTAALQSEILRESEAETRDFAVVEVTRAGLEALTHWPTMGGPTHQWLPRSTGPDSLLIRAGDRITLTVWDNDPNSLLTGEGQKQVDISDLPVAPEGTIHVPYLDEVVVNGLTPDQARRTIQDQLDDILPSAQVQLTVMPGRRSSVDLLGGVASAGSYPLPDRNFSVLNLISAGGGVATGLGNPQVRLLRDGRVYRIALRRLTEDPRLDTVLRGGDTVTLEEDERSFVALGAAGQQDIIPFGRDRVSALDAVSLIGGVEGSRGTPGGILVLREYPPQAVRADGIGGPDRARVVFTLDLTSADGLFSARQFTIAPDDVVLVTEAPLNSVTSILGLFGQSLGLAGRAGRL